MELATTCATVTRATVTRATATACPSYPHLPTTSGGLSAQKHGRARQVVLWVVRPSSWVPATLPSAQDLPTVLPVVVGTKQGAAVAQETLRAGKPPPCRAGLPGRIEREGHTILWPPAPSLGGSPAQKESATSQREDSLEQPSARPVRSQVGMLCGDNLSCHDSLLLGLFSGHPGGPRRVRTLLWKIPTDAGCETRHSSSPQILFWGLAWIYAEFLCSE